MTYFNNLKLRLRLFWDEHFRYVTSFGDIIRIMRFINEHPRNILCKEENLKILFGKTDYEAFKSFAFGQERFCKYIGIGKTRKIVTLTQSGAIELHRLEESSNTRKATNLLALATLLIALSSIVSAKILSGTALFLVELGIFVFTIYVVIAVFKVVEIF